MTLNGSDIALHRKLVDSPADMQDVWLDIIGGRGWTPAATA